jgi:D-glycero-D-manno-heptose 1,7-bisphosphate phosphatase
MLAHLNIGENSCLFLDRDGVINKRLIDEYVKQWDEFVFMDGVFEALQILQNHFKTIVIVTNQQGIGKGLYSVEDLHHIHNNMLMEFEKNDITIHAVFFAPQLKSENSNMRKPAIGMALKAKQIFNNIELDKSIMVGDTISDMQFGKNAHMKTIFIGSDENIIHLNKNSIDFQFNSLLSFAKNIE